MTCPWQGWVHAPAAFCEASLCGWIRQPGNAWSNVGFVVAGLVIWRETRADRRLRVMAWILFGMAAGSAFFHASETRIGMWLDYAGMYAMAAYMDAFVLTRALRLGRIGRALAFAAVCAVGGLAFALPGAPVRGMFLLANAVCPATEAALAVRPATRAPSYRWFVAAYAALLPAAILWVLDEREVLCVPANHLLSGHAAWHLLDALMFGCSYRYYRDVLGAAA